MLSIALVSVNPTGTAVPNGNSDFVATTVDNNDLYFGSNQSNPGSLSADGSKLVFVSDVNNLVGSPDGSNPVASADGTNNQGTAVFVRDTTTGQTSLVSVTPNGAPANGDSFDPVISPNGRYVAFISEATNLTPVGVGTTVFVPNLPAVGYLYVRDLQTQTTTLLDQTPSGQMSDGFSTGQFVFSPDSTTLAWFDTSDNLTTATLDPLSRPNAADQSPTYAYVRDLATQTTSLVSASTGGQASGSFNPNLNADLVFSPDSQSLVFGSSATDLTANLPDNSGNPEATLGALSPQNLFLRNLATGTTTLISVTTAGLLPVQGDSSGVVFSPDGKSLAFSSDVTNLTANGTDFTAPASVNSLLTNPTLAVINIFIRNLTTATTTLVTGTPNGLQSSGIAAGPVFSPDGSTLAFISSATDLTSNPLDTTPPPVAAAFSQENGFAAPIGNVFLRNLAEGKTTLVSATPSGKLSSGAVNEQTPLGPLVFSPNGRYLAYTSDASDLTKNPIETAAPLIAGLPSLPTVPGPALLSNVFVTDLETGTTTLASVTTSGQLSNGGSASWLSFSPDSGSLFFTSNAIDLTSNPPATTISPASLATSLIGDIPATSVSPAVASPTTTVSPTTGASPATTGDPLAPNFSGVNLFVRDLTAGTTSLISATTSGQLSDSISINPIISPDGQTIYFDSDAANLTTGDTNPSQSTDIFAAAAPFTIPNQFQFQSWESSAQESSGQVVVTVLRSGPATAAASVNYAVQNGSAQAGTDFKAAAGTLNFAAGQTSETFTVPLVKGDDFAGTRSASLVLSNPQGATLGYPSAALNLTSVPPAIPPTASPVTPVVVKPGPTVVSVAPVTGRHGITSLVITFDQALSPASALDAANYQVSLPGRTLHARRGHQTVTRPGRTLAITTVDYNPATHQVTLTLHKLLRRGKAYQLQINGASGGVAATNGTPLYSPGTLKPGKDYLAAVDLVAQHGK